MGRAPVNNYRPSASGALALADVDYLQLSN